MAPRATAASAAGTSAWIELTASDGVVGLRGGDGQFTPVHALRNGDLVMPLPHAPAPARVRILTAPGGHPDYAVVLDGGETFSFNSASGPPSPAAAARAARDAVAYAGDYTSTGTGPESSQYGDLLTPQARDPAITASRHADGRRLHPGSMSMQERGQLTSRRSHGARLRRAAGQGFRRE